MTEKAVIKPFFFLDENQQVEYYNNWAQKYEEDSAKVGYNAPENTLEFCLKWLKSSDSDRILDVGCGTGHMGNLLLQHGYNNLDGHDGSEKMLEIAKQKRVYQNLYYEILVPGKHSNIPSESYDGLVTVGTILPGHLNSDHVSEMLRFLKKDGRLIIGMRKQWLTFPGDEYKWNYDLESEFKKLEQEGKWKLLEKKFKNEHSSGVEGVYLVYEKL
uniref:Methyltransferase domain-containing protein n=1 Tax=Acrobeloides nanus TaxID=290746 RepID=A0A914CVS4_9BILA